MFGLTIRGGRGSERARFRGLRKERVRGNAQVGGV
jgi:hypothetical protein